MWCGRKTKPTPTGVAKTRVNETQKCLFLLGGQPRVFKDTMRAKNIFEQKKRQDVFQLATLQIVVHSTRAN